MLLTINNILSIQCKALEIMMIYDFYIKYERHLSPFDEIKLSNNSLRKNKQFLSKENSLSKKRNITIQSKVTKLNSNEHNMNCIK